jgi:hypothetical protein
MDDLFTHYGRVILELNYSFTITRLDYYSETFILSSLCNFASVVIIKDDL